MAQQLCAVSVLNCCGPENKLSGSNSSRLWAPMDQARRHDNALLCATSVFSVSLWLMNSEQKHTTETQRTQRLHRELG